MKIGILGTGIVGRTLAKRLLELGHDVMIGGRSIDSGRASATEIGGSAQAGDFAATADFADLAILAVQGGVARSVVAGVSDQLAGKTLIDVTNPLDFSEGFPPKLIAGLQNEYSLGEALQADLPQTRVVKSLNTMANMIMVDPGALEQQTDVFVAGDDPDAKAMVSSLLRKMGWPAPIDMGGIEASRGLEAILLFWTRVMGPMGGDGMFNIKLVRTPDGG